jgi:hypothetical protein
MVRSSSMPQKPGTGSLLDRLRKESDAIRSQVVPTRPVEEVLREIDQRLFKTYRWIEEALAHLEVIKPVVAHEFRIDSLPAMSGLQFDRGFVSYRRRPRGGHDLIDHLEMFYRLVSPNTFRLRVSTQSATSVEERLRQASIAFRYQPVHDENRVAVGSVFVYTPAVTGSVRFEPDYRRQSIEVRLTNIDRMETVCLEFAPESLDEPALDDLLRLMLGESNAFLRRAPLAGIGASRREEPPPEAAVYRVEKTVRPR